jgi:hypothetical protein
VRCCIASPGKQPAFGCDARRQEDCDAEEDSSRHAHDHDRLTGARWWSGGEPRRRSGR